MHHHVVLRITTKLMVAPIMLFALYVLWHGDFGPGGGFQAGVIFATGFILYGLIFGIRKAKLVAPPAVIIRVMSVGVLIYGGVGVAAMMLGGNLLDYSALAGNALHGQHLGINLIEFGVGTTVAATIISLFYSFAS